MNKQAEELQPIPMVNGLDCPACGHPTLILGNGGYITCSLEGCPNPDYAEALEAHAQAEKERAARIDEIEKFSNWYYFDRLDGRELPIENYKDERLAELQKGGSDG